MRREPAHGRDEEATPVQEGLSTEDIAQTETEAPQRPAKDDLTAVPNAGQVASRTRTTDAAGDKPDIAADERDTSSRGPDAAPLLEPKQAEDLRFQWKEIQQGFVDDPQKSVRAADGLVAEVMQLLATTFAGHKDGLEGQWHRGEAVATEDLRVALQQYRSFFDRLLST